MSQKKITLNSIKQDMANDPIYQAMPKSLKKNAILQLVEIFDTNPQYILTPSSKEAIIKYANSLK